MDNSTTEEIWKAIPGYEGRYEASTEGRIRKIIATKTSKHYPYWIMKPSTFQDNGYLRVSMSIRGKHKSCRIHRLVLLTFVGDPPDGKPQTNHKNGIKTDNRLCNLEWVSSLENIRHSIFTGLKPPTTKGEKHHTAKLTRQDVIEIRRQYKAGARQHELAKSFHISRPHISSIVHGRTWSHVPDYLEDQPTVNPDGSVQLSLFSDSG